MSFSVLRPAVALMCLSLLGAPLGAQRPSRWSVLERPRTRAPQPTTRAITPADLMSRLYVFADDSMGGRELDTRGNAMGVEHLAREAARIGLVPAGDNGTFFQKVPLSYRTLDSTRTFAFGGRLLTPWVDFIPRDQGAGARTIDGVPSVYGGTWGVPASLIDARAAAGKLVILSVAPAGYAQGIPGSAAWADVSARFPDAAGFAVAGLDVMPRQIIPFYRNAGASFTPTAPAPSFLYISKGLGAELFGGRLDSLTPGASGRSFTGSRSTSTVHSSFPPGTWSELFPAVTPGFGGSTSLSGPTTITSARFGSRCPTTRSTW